MSDTRDPIAEQRARNEAIRDRIADTLAGNVGRERRTIDVETRPPINATVSDPVLSNTNPRTLSDLDLRWLDGLDRANLSPHDATTLRVWRRRSTRSDEHRLLDGLLAVDDQRRVSVDDRRAMQGELHLVEGELRRGGGVNSEQALQVDRWRAESVVRESLDGAIREENERWRGDPRRVDDKRVWTGSEYVEEGYTEHQAKLRKIEASRDRLVEAALADLQTERANTWNQRRSELLRRQAELKVKLAQNGT